MSKEQIRKMISEKKQEMTEEEIRGLSEELTRIFCSLEEFQRADCLFAYCSFNQEVRTGAIIRTALETGKRVAVPKVLGDRLEFRYIRSEQDLEISSLGIPEPKDGLETADGREEEILVDHPVQQLTVGTLQAFLDEYAASHHEIEIDYIHDEDSLRALAAKENAIGFLFDGMEKDELFRTVIFDGALPRKTFSMGHARDKRYYLDCRKIK